MNKRKKVKLSVEINSDLYKALLNKVNVDSTNKSRVIVEALELYLNNCDIT